MREAKPTLAEQFDDLAQQEYAATTGMWVFLATEVLFFGGLFLAYLVYRTAYPSDFAIGSAHSNVLLGTINTALLLTSSFSMALAVHTAQAGNGKGIRLFLLATIALGIVFLILKGVEYHQHYSEGFFPGKHFKKGVPKPVELFFWLYFVMTGLHAIHVFIGVSILSVMIILASQRRFSAAYANPLKVAGLYWHFVDLVWVFLYPLFYLIRN